MKYCPYCGMGLQNSMVFCPSCGKRFLGATKGVEENAGHGGVSDNLPTMSTDNVQAAETDIQATSVAEPEVNEALVDENPTIEGVGDDSTESEQGLHKAAMPPRLFVIGIVAILAIIVGIALTLGGNSNVIESKANSVLYLELYDTENEIIGSGSGFYVNNGITLVTNYHVIDGVNHIIAYSADGKQQTDINTVLAYDKSIDLAVLKCEIDLGLQPIVLGDSNKIRQGDKVFAIGYPLGVANTLSDGVVSSLYEDKNSLVIQTTAAISSGSSGGVLLNGKGEAIGVTTASYVDGQNLNIAIPINYVKSILKEQKPRLLNELFPPKQQSTIPSSSPSTPITPIAQGAYQGTWTRIDDQGILIQIVINGREASVECKYVDSSVQGGGVPLSSKSNHGTLRKLDQNSWVIDWDSAINGEQDSIIYGSGTNILMVLDAYKGSYQRN